MRDLHATLSGSIEWTASGLEACVTAWFTSKKLELKDIGQPLRVALTGRSASPSLFDVLALLGRDVSLARLSRAAPIAEAS